MRSLYLIIVVLLVACTEATEKSNIKPSKEDNKAVTISTDTATLSHLINLKTHRPFAVKFKYQFINNAGTHERLSVPGPSDYYLEALLYFDSATFNRIRTAYFYADYPSPGFQKNEFNFDWLDANTRSELLQTDTAYHGHPDILFGSGANGKMWLLNNKLLLITSSM